MQEVFLSGVDDDLKSLCTEILKSSKDGNSLLGSDEVGVMLSFKCSHLFSLGNG